MECPFLMKDRNDIGMDCLFLMPDLSPVASLDTGTGEDKGSHYSGMKTYCCPMLKSDQFHPAVSIA